MPARLAFVLLLSLLCGVTAHAQSDAKLAKVNELFRAMHTEQLSRQIMDQVMNQVTGQVNDTLLHQAESSKPTAEQQKIVDDMQAQLKAVLERTLGFAALQGEYAKLYANAYTDEQLDAILAFYRSPAGQALVEKTPTLLDQTIAIAREHVATATPEIQEIVRGAMERLTRATPPPPASKSPSGQ